MEMNINDILTLGKMGYTKNEINALMGGSTPEPDPTPDPSPDPTPDPTPDPAPEPTPTQSNDDVMAALAALTKQVESLTKAQQAQNRAGSNMQIVTAQKTDDILAGIINKSKK